MIHCIVSYIQIYTSGSCGHDPLLVIFYVLSEVYYVWHRSDIYVYGFSVSLNIDCLYNLSTLFSVKHLLSISSSPL